jgi:hypothetical protein
VIISKYVRCCLDDHCKIVKDSLDLCEETHGSMVKLEVQETHLTCSVYSLFELAYRDQTNQALLYECYPANV